MPIRQSPVRGLLIRDQTCLSSPAGAPARVLWLRGVPTNCTGRQRAPLHVQMMLANRKLDSA